MPTVTLDGVPVRLIGNEIRPGQKAPEFTVQNRDLGDYTYADGRGTTRIFAAVPSLYTGVCNRETRRFNEEAAKVPGITIVVISADLPFAQTSWCGAAGVDRVTMTSDHREMSFGAAYGCLIDGGPFDRCLCRAVFVVGPDDISRHVEYVPEIGQEPDYEAVLAAARAAATEP